MTLENEPLVQLVTEVPHRRQPDFLERVFREERSKGPQNDDDQHRHQETPELNLAAGFFPPAVKLVIQFVAVIDDPTTLAFRRLTQEDRVDKTILHLFFL